MSFNVCNESTDCGEHGFSLGEREVFIDIHLGLDVLHRLAIAAIEGQLERLVPDIRVIMSDQLHELLDEQLAVNAQQSLDVGRGLVRCALLAAAAFGLRVALLCRHCISPYFRAFHVAQARS